MSTTSILVSLYELGKQHGCWARQRDCASLIGVAKSTLGDHLSGKVTNPSVLEETERKFREYFESRDIAIPHSRIPPPDGGAAEFVELFTQLNALLAELVNRLESAVQLPVEKVEERRTLWNAIQPQLDRFYALLRCLSKRTPSAASQHLLEVERRLEQLKDKLGD